MGVVVVVPALAEAQQRHPPAVAREVGGIEVAVAEGVGGRVHQPGHVVDHRQPQRDGPEHQAQPAATDAGVLAIEIKGDAERQLQQQEPVVEPAVEGIALQIAGETVNLPQGRDVVQHPLAVGPPQPPAGVVVVVGLVGVEVVVAVQPHPFDGAALAGHRPHQHQEALHPLRGVEAAVGHQPVQAEGDPHHREPIHHSQRGHPLPAPEARQKCGNRPHVDHQHEDGGTATQLALAKVQGLPRCHQASPQAGLAIVAGLESVAGGGGRFGRFGDLRAKRHGSKADVSM